MSHRIKSLPVRNDHFRLTIFFQKWIQDQGGIWQCVIEPSQAGIIKTYHVSHMMSLTS